MEPLELRRIIQGSDKKILFCGDDDLDLAAIYLASIIHEESYDFDYVPSLLTFPNEINLGDYDLFIFSDYPREQIKNERMEEIVQVVKKGASFLMIGGWESFTGRNIEYKKSAFEAILPVSISDKDDRRNYDQGIAVLSSDLTHAVNKGLDWSRPGIIGGYNEFIPKEHAQCVCLGQKVLLSLQEGKPHASMDEAKIPLLVYGQAEKGRTAALAFDLAPHWVGGFVDWGKHRKHVDFADGFIEVGDQYYKFVANLLKSMF